MLLLFFCLILLGHALPSCLSVRLSGRLVMMGIFIMLWVGLLAILAEGAIALSVTHSLLLRSITHCIASMHMHYLEYEVVHAA